MQRQWARLARRGWCAGVVPTAPRSLEIIRREMRQAEPLRGAGQRRLLWAYKWCSGALSCSLRGVARVRGGGNPISIDQRSMPGKEK